MVILQYIKRFLIANYRFLSVTGVGYILTVVLVCGLGFDL